MKLRSPLIASLAIATLALSACSAAPESESLEGTTLTFWAANMGTSLENDKEILTPVLEQFEEETGISVDLEVIGWGDLLTRIQTAVVSGQGADVVNIGNSWAVALAATGAFMPFDESGMEAVGGTDKFDATALDAAGAPGEPPTSLPQYGLAIGLYYNKAMFEEAGLEPPSNWDELVDAAKALTTDGVYGMALPAGSVTSNAALATILSAQNDTAWFDDDGNPTFTEQGHIDGIKRYLDLMQEHKVVNPANAEYNLALLSSNDFAAGKAAMIFNANNAARALGPAGMTSDDYDVVPVPAPIGGTAISSPTQGINISIFKHTKHKKAAQEFVKFMTSEGVLAQLSKPFAALSVLKGVASTYTDDEAEAKTFTEIFNTMSVPSPQVPNTDQFERLVGTAMTQMFAAIATGATLTEDDIREALQAAQSQVTPAG